MQSELSAELEAALVRELARCYDRLNWKHFGDRLRLPVLVAVEHDAATRAVDARDAHARAVARARHRAAVARGDRRCSSTRWRTSSSTRCSAFATRARTARRSGGCARSAASTRVRHGAPVARATRRRRRRSIERIRKLLALAGSSNQHEAEIAMKQGARADAAPQHRAVARCEREFEVRHLGEPRTPRERASRPRSSALLSEFFFVEVIRIPVYLPRDGHARGASTRSRARARTSRWRATSTRSCSRPPSGCGKRTAATRACAAAATALAVSVRRDPRVSREAAVLERVELRGAGLVWVGDKRLEDFYRRRNPRIVKRRRSIRLTRARRGPRGRAHGRVAQARVERPELRRGTAARRVAGARACPRLSRASSNIAFADAAWGTI